jgi:tRNA nucleotidyltransferase (CCA-adding enzyme)
MKQIDTNKIKNKIPKEIMEILEILDKKNFDGYIVGGSIRDIILGLEPKDWDITTNATPEQILNLFPDSFYENEFGTVGVKVRKTTPSNSSNLPPLQIEGEFPTSEKEQVEIVEITPYRSEGNYTDGRRPDEIKFVANIDEDLKRRDFTINAIAFSPIKDILIDNFEGIKDIENKVLRTVGEPDERFGEDYLRMIRAIRIATQLNFNIENKTLESIKKNNKNIEKISWERIRDEFIKLINCETPIIGFLNLEYTGLINHIMPELMLGKGMTQTQAHKYDVYGHLLRSMQHAADKKYSYEIRIAALLHDIAKPHTARWNESTKQNSFHGHEVVGEKVARKILTRLKMPQSDIDKICKLIRWHMFNSDPDQITMSAVRRMVANVGVENIWDLMNIRLCDRIGSGRPMEEPYRLRRYYAMLEEAMKDPISVKMLKINGDIMINKLKMKPGKQMGLILLALLGEVLEDTSKNNEEYLEKRAIELYETDFQVLKKLAEKGELEKEEIEEEQKIEINHKFNIRN